MSWQIDLFHVAPGQNPCKVRDVQYGWEEHDGYSIDAPSTASDRWVEQVVGLLESVAPGLKILDQDGRPDVTADERGHVTHVQVWQPHGPLIANVYPYCADVRVHLDYPESRDGEYFEALWRACSVLAEHAGCAAFPQYDDDPVDTALPIDEARLVYDDWV